MSESLYERYKETLRVGHVAVLRGHLDDALLAYRQAAEVAPQRALPHTSLGGVFLTLGRVDEALAEFDTALQLAPADEGALLGRAEALVRGGATSEAATVLDQLAEAQEAAGQLNEACDTLRRALALRPSGVRRRRYLKLVRTVRISEGDRDAEDALARALHILEPSAKSAGGQVAGTKAASAKTGPGAAEPPPVAAMDRAMSEATAGAEITADEGVPVEPVADPLAKAEATYQAAVSAVDHEDRPAAIGAFLDAARGYAQTGRSLAALEACEEVLRLDPDEIEAHLLLVEIYRARGWRELALDKVTRLLRIAELSGDESARGRIEVALGGARATSPQGQATVPEEAHRPPATGS